MDLSEAAADQRQVTILAQAVAAAMAAESRSLGIDCEVRSFDPGAVRPAEFVHAARLHRVTPLLHAHDAELGLSEEVSALLQEESTASAVAAMSLVTQIAQAVAVLEDAGVSALVFKGPVLSLLTTGTTIARGGGDLDMLVDPADIPGAVRAFEAKGWSIESYSPGLLARAWPAIRWCDRELAVLGPYAAIDLHWQLAKERGVLPAVDELLGDSREIDLGGRRIRTLGQRDTLLAAAYQLEHDHYRSLRHVIDLVRLLRAQQRPIGGDERWRPMMRRAAWFSAELVGGVSSAHLEHLGLARVPVDGAQAAWHVHGVLPISGFPEVAAGQMPAQLRARLGLGNPVVELARAGMRRVLARSG